MEFNDAAQCVWINEVTISVVALVISGISVMIAIATMIQGRRMNTTNLQSKYFDKIFTEFLTSRIPEALDKVRFVNNRLDKSYKDVVNVMMEMVEKSKYFSFAKPKFYKELNEKTIALEDKLINCAAKQIPSREMQKEFIEGVYKDMKDIIKLINKNYHNF